MVSLADPALLGPGQGRPRTIAAFARAGLGAGNGFIFASQYQNYSIANSSFALGLSYRNDPPVVGILSDGTAAVYRAPPGDGATGFHHYAATFDTANNLGTIYVDGVALPSGPLTFSQVSARPLTIGGLLPPEPHYFFGEVDDFMVFDRVLSPAEIAQLALGGCSD